MRALIRLADKYTAEHLEEACRSPAVHLRAGVSRATPPEGWRPKTVSMAALRASPPRANGAGPPADDGRAGACGSRVTAAAPGAGVSAWR